MRRLEQRETELPRSSQTSLTSSLVAAGMPVDHHRHTNRHPMSSSSLSSALPLSSPPSASSEEKPPSVRSDDGFSSAHTSSVSSASSSSSSSLTNFTSSLSSTSFSPRSVPSPYSPSESQVNASPADSSVFVETPKTSDISIQDSIAYPQFEESRGSVAQGQVQYSGAVSTGQLQRGGGANNNVLLYTCNSAVQGNGVQDSMALGSSVTSMFPFPPTGGGMGVSASPGGSMPQQHHTVDLVRSRNGSNYSQSSFSYDPTFSNGVYPCPSSTLSRNMLQSARSSSTDSIPSVSSVSFQNSHSPVPIPQVTDNDFSNPHIPSNFNFSSSNTSPYSANHQNSADHASLQSMVQDSSMLDSQLFDINPHARNDSGLQNLLGEIVSLNDNSSYTAPSSVSDSGLFTSHHHSYTSNSHTSTTFQGNI